MTSPSPSSWQSAPSVRAAQVRTVAVLFVAQALGGLAVGAGTAMGSLVAYEVTRDEAMAGVVRIASAVGVSLFAGPMALLAVQRGRRTALLSGWGAALAGGLVTLAALAAHNLLLLVVGTIVFSAGSAANLQMRFAATDMELPARRGRTISLVVWAATIGSVLSPMLVGPGASLARRLGLPEISGVYLIAGAGLLATVGFITVALRPDPMRVAQEHGESPRGGGASTRLPVTLRRTWAVPRARLALVTAPVNQAVMTGVMVLTPVHMHHTGHSLSSVGLTLSIHIAGMFALSPLVGWLSDRHLGEVRAILAGMAIHATALACTFLAGGNMLLLNVGLFLLGLGWSFGSVAGASLLVGAVPDDIRAHSQGAMDTLANLGAAAAAAAAGPVMAAAGYDGLSVLAAACLAPVVVAALLLRGTTPRQA